MFDHKIPTYKEASLFKLHYENFFRKGEEIIEEGIKNGSINPNINVKVFKFFLMGGMKYLLENWAKNVNDFSLITIRQNVKLIIKKGILG